MKEPVNMRLDKKLANWARKEAENTKRTFSLYIEWLISKDQSLKKGK